MFASVFASCGAALHSKANCGSQHEQPPGRGRGGVYPFPLGLRTIGCMDIRIHGVLDNVRTYDDRTLET